MKLLRMLTAVLSAAGAGCGFGDLCGAYVDAHQSLDTKANACYNTRLPKVSRTQCNEHVRECTSFERAQVSAYIDCINSMSVCVESAHRSFVEQGRACGKKVEELGSKCKTSFDYFYH